MKKIVVAFLTVLLAINSVFAAGAKRGGAGDITPYLTESDAREICKDIVWQIIQSPRIAKFEDKNGRAPIVTVGKIKDQTGEFFDTQLISNNLKTVILNSGVMEFMANSDVRDAMREEVMSQADHSREDVAKELDEEDAADYMLTGSVKLSVVTNGKIQERTYSVNIELTDLQTHRTVGMFEPSEETKQRMIKSAKIKSR